MDVFLAGSFNSEVLRIYHVEAYRYALSIIPICSVLGAILISYVGVKLFSATKNSVCDTA